MNDLFQDPFSGVTTSHSHRSDQASVDNIGQDEVSSKKSELVVKKRERAPKRKTLQFDSDISLTKNDIADLQQGLVSTFYQAKMEQVSLEWCMQQLQEPPICKQNI
jgi:hypothetical protein